MEWLIAHAEDPDDEPTPVIEEKKTEEVEQAEQAAHSLKCDE